MQEADTLDLVGDGERRFATLNVDAIQQITEMLPTSSLLALTAVSQELRRTFCSAVVSLSVSKVSLRRTTLRGALIGLSQRYPTLTDLNLAQSGATDDDVRFVAESANEWYRSRLTP